jgi:hypothetical protein
MQKVHSESELKRAIAHLENKQDEERKALRRQFDITYESIKPVNLIKSTLKEAASSVEIRESFFVTAVGITTGYLSKKLFVGTSHSPLKKLIGAALLFGITNVIARHPEAVKLVGRVALKFIGRLLGSKRHNIGKNENDEYLEYRPS